MAIQRLSVQIGADVTQAIGGVKKLSASIETLRAKMEVRKQLLLTETDLTKIAKYNKEIAVLKGRIGEITSIGTSNFGKLSGASADAASKISQSFTNAFSAVRTAANILPGIGIAGLIGIFSDSISKLVGNLFKLGEATNKAKVAQEALNEAMESDEYIKASTSISELAINIDLAKRGLLDKKDVLKQYNESLGKATGEVKTLDEAEQALVKNGPAYLKMLLFQAAAHIALEKAAKKAVEAEIDFQDAMRKVSNISSQGADKDKSAGAAGLGEFLASGVKNEANAAKKTADKRVNALNDVAKKFQEDAAKIAQEFNFEFFKPDPKTGGSKAKTIKIDTPKFEFRTDLLGDLNVDKTVTDLFKRLNDEVKASDAPSEFEKSFQDKLKKSLEKPIPARVNIAPEMTPETLSAAEELAEKYSELINSALQKTAVEGLSGIGEVIGTAIAGGDLENAFKGLFTSLGGAVSELGKQIIALSPLVASIKLAIKSFSPIGILAAGVGMVALGAVIKSSFKGSQFAEGGLVFGPTMGMVGEGIGTTRSNPEVVAPLDKLKKFIGGGQQAQVFIPELHVGYDKWRISFNRANKQGGMFE